MKTLKTLLGFLVISLLFNLGAMAAQCQAITKKGTQCKRQADISGNYCWQHKTNANNSENDSATGKNVAPKSAPTKSVSVQCKAVTKKGTRCKRKAESSSNYCWQHSRAKN